MLDFSQALAAVRKYDPDQPRDDIGRWTDGGGGITPGDGQVSAASVTRAEELWNEYGTGSAIKEVSAGEKLEPGDTTVAGSKLTAEDVASINEAARTLQAVAETGRIMDRMGVYRGMVLPDGTDVKGMFQRYKMVDRSVAEKYMDPQFIGEESGVPVMINIQRKGGVVGHQSGLKDFNEAVLPRGARYRVSSVRQEDGVWNVTLYDKGDLNG